MFPFKSRLVKYYDLSAPNLLPPKTNEYPIIPWKMLGLEDEPFFLSHGPFSGDVNISGGNIILHRMWRSLLPHAAYEIGSLESKVAAKAGCWRDLSAVRCRLGWVYLYGPRSILKAFGGKIWRDGNLYNCRWFFHDPFVDDWIVLKKPVEHFHRWQRWYEIAIYGLRVCSLISEGLQSIGNPWA